MVLTIDVFSENIGEIHKITSFPNCLAFKRELEILPECCIILAVQNGTMRREEQLISFCLLDNNLHIDCFLLMCS